MKDKSIACFYKLFKCIQSCKTLEQLECCERMINNLKGLMATEYLAEQALLKRVDFMTAQYPEVEA
jgi:hypothetical protein